MAKVKITSDGRIEHLYINENEMRDVSKYYIKHQTGQTSKLYLEINADEFEFNGNDVEVKIEYRKKIVPIEP